MSVTVGVINVVIGVVYTSYGLMTAADLWRNRQSAGMSHFGLAWMAMAFTCGPHHLEHGTHVLFDGRTGLGLDLAASAVGLPAGVIWFLLRVEGSTGGRGDRPIHGTPPVLAALPALASAYLVAFVTVLAATWAGVASFDNRLIPNLALVGLYIAIGVVLGRTQLQNHQTDGGWSLSGLSLTVVFPTCALMHMAWVVYASAGSYDIDGHLLAIDTLAVPAAVYFLWVVWSLHRGTLDDWTAGRDTSPLEADDAPLEWAGT